MEMILSFRLIVIYFMCRYNVQNVTNLSIDSKDSVNDNTIELTSVEHITRLEDE